MGMGVEDTDNFSYIYPQISKQGCNSIQKMN